MVKEHNINAQRHAHQIKSTKNTHKLPQHHQVLNMLILAKLVVIEVIITFKSIQQLVIIIIDVPMMKPVFQAQSHI